MGDKKVPWFLAFDDEFIIITSPMVPTGEIRSTKQIIRAATEVPGLNYTPTSGNRGGNLMVEFSIGLLDRRNVSGIKNVCAAIELLRNQNFSIFGGGRFSVNEDTPTCVYYWGTHLPPLRYKVVKADFRHNPTIVPRIGLSYFGQVDFSLELIENDTLYDGWQFMREISARIGIVTSITQLTGGSNVRGY